ncbi:hypothetical protein Agabi119p4_3309 [Agaricus bisporus var. burnettii]|uniref:BTB domain-containing protein n=1 Tax=Agaricus bisporus var. burnettii TaxID=192524 RepID=A0A8H7F709_AGABI|nr:hypothetical protein Agabi119p4_3309 [Agaricus bisporus var. burnettii]
MLAMSDSGLRKHSIYWFDDASLVLHVQAVLFRVHLPLLERHSPFIASLEKMTSSYEQIPIVIESSVPLVYVTFGDERPVRDTDVEALLEHMYHDLPLSSDSPFERVVAVLRSSSPSQLHLPALHAKAKQYFSSMFTTKMLATSTLGDLHEALSIARSLRLESILKVVLYQIMVSSNLDDETAHPTDTQMTNASQPLSSQSATSTENKNPLENVRRLPGADIQLCKSLMTQIIDYFTPILFTPAATPHMTCTDVFADTWMPLVISPAIENDGVYKPIETLERMKQIDWASHGLCGACVAEKCEEWSEEQENVWALVEKLLKAESSII